MTRNLLVTPSSRLHEARKQVTIAIETVEEQPETTTDEQRALERLSTVREDIDQALELLEETDDHYADD